MKERKKANDLCYCSPKDPPVRPSLDTVVCSPGRRGSRIRRIRAPLDRSKCAFSASRDLGKTSMLGSSWIAFRDIKNCKRRNSFINATKTSTKKSSGKKNGSTQTRNTAFTSPYVLTFARQQETDRLATDTKLPSTSTASPPPAPPNSAPQPPGSAPWPVSSPSSSSQRCPASATTS